MLNGRLTLFNLACLLSQHWLMFHIPCGVRVLRFCRDGPSGERAAETTTGSPPSRPPAPFVFHLWTHSLCRRATTRRRPALCLALGADGVWCRACPSRPMGIDRRGHKWRGSGAGTCDTSVTRSPAARRRSVPGAPPQSAHHDSTRRLPAKSPLEAELEIPAGRAQTTLSGPTTDR